MTSTLLALALTLSSLFSFSPFNNLTTPVQDPSMAIGSAASGLAYSNGVTTPFGMNSYAALYPINGNFNTTSGGSYSCSPNFNTTGCGGLYASFVLSGTNTPTYAGIVYASPTQINLIIPVVPSDGGYYTVFLWKTADDSFERGLSDIRVLSRTIQPFLHYGTFGGVSGGYWVGSLYGYTVDGGGNITGTTYLKSLTDGTANPRTYNGKPTIPQVYYTGVRDNSDNGVYSTWETYNQGGISYYGEQFGTTVYQESIGVYKTNFVIPTSGASWEAGTGSGLIYYNNPLVQHADTRIRGKIWFAN